MSPPQQFGRAVSKCHKLTIKGDREIGGSGDREINQNFPKNSPI